MLVVEGISTSEVHLRQESPALLVWIMWFDCVFRNNNVCYLYIHFIGYRHFIGNREVRDRYGLDGEILEQAAEEKRAEKWRAGGGPKGQLSQRMGADWDTSWLIIGPYFHWFAWVFSG